MTIRLAAVSAHCRVMSCRLQSSVMQTVEQNCYADRRVVSCRLQSTIVMQVAEQNLYADCRVVSFRLQSRSVIKTAEQCHAEGSAESCRLQRSVMQNCRLHTSVIHFMKAARVYDLPLLQYYVGSWYQFIRFVCNWPTIAVVMMTRGGLMDPGSLVIIPPCQHCIGMTEVGGQFNFQF